MTVNAEIKNVDQRTTQWSKLQAWFKAVDERLNYDSQERADAMIKQLWQKVEQLEIGVNEREASHRAVI